MNPLVIVFMDLAEQDLVGFGNGSDIVSGADTNDMILNPAIRTFNFAFGLRGQSVDDFDLAIVNDLFPLRD